MTTTGVVANLVLLALLTYLAWLTPVLSVRSVRFGVRVPESELESADDMDQIIRLVLRYRS